MKKCLDKTWAKVTFFCLLVLFSILLAAAAAGITFLIGENVYLDGGKSLFEYTDFQTDVSYLASLVRCLISGRYLLIVLAAVFLGLFIFCLVFTLASAGHWKGYEGIHLTWFDRIPIEPWIALGFLFFILFDETVHYSTLAILLLIPAMILFYLFLTAFAAQCKAGTVIKDSLTTRVLRILWRGVKWLLFVIGRIPLVWKTALGVLALLIFDAVCLFNTYEEEFIVIFLFVNALAGLFLIYLAIGMRKLQKCGQALAEGDYKNQADTSHLIGDFRRHGEDLNAIQQGIRKAVEEQLRAERMRTELITNVSHDIKTPLTSIVNYVDLLKKEAIGNTKAEEYIGVLDRQSQRLKKLTEDLVEASKAATGSLPVSLTDTDVNVLLSQVTGEYMNRLSEKDLTSILTPDEKEPHILADGQLLWRTLDNLLSNVCKYAQPGTRVYLSSEVLQGEGLPSLNLPGKVGAMQDLVYITVRNISSYPLNISAEELTERFVRGDSSRTTEGSGLGLSIAMSLTKLMNGEFRLSVDGDLFKVQLIFRRLQ